MKYIVLGLLLIITIALVGMKITGVFNIENSTITVKEKFIKHNKNGSTYLIASEAGNVYMINDSIMEMRFDSSDLYIRMEVGETYLIRTRGKRIHFLSMYKNIMEAKRKEKW